MNVLLSNIQRFSLHDGPGIRTTVFLMGCMLRCPWCCNPENLSASAQLFVRHSKCSASNGICEFADDCFALREDADRFNITAASQCPVGALGIYGKKFGPDALVAEILRDRPFYESGGGVTFSGGEPFLQSEALLPVVRALKSEGIDICFESCLGAPESSIRLLLPFIDRMYFDVKILDSNEAARKLGYCIDDYMKKAILIASSLDHLIVRFPIVPGYTDGKSNLERVSRFLGDIKPEKCEIFSVHNLAESKYLGLGLPFHKFETLDDDLLKKISNRMSHYSDCPIEICHL